MVQVVDAQGSPRRKISRVAKRRTGLAAGFRRAPAGDRFWKASARKGQTGRFSGDRTIQQRSPAQAGPRCARIQRKVLQFAPGGSSPRFLTDHADSGEKKRGGGGGGVGSTTAETGAGPGRHADVRSSCQRLVEDQNSRWCWRCRWGRRRLVVKDLGEHAIRKDSSRSITTTAIGRAQGGRQSGEENQKTSETGLAPGPCPPASSLGPVQGSGRGLVIEDQAANGSHCHATTR